MGNGEAKWKLRKGVEDGTVTVERVGETFAVTVYGTESEAQDFEVSGKTYGLGPMLKSEFAATWDADRKVWRTHIAGTARPDGAYNLMLDLIGELD